MKETIDARVGKHFGQTHAAFQVVHLDNGAAGLRYNSARKARLRRHGSVHSGSSFKTKTLAKKLLEEPLNEQYLLFYSASMRSIHKILRDGFDARPEARWASWAWPCTSTKTHQPPTTTT